MTELNIEDLGFKPVQKAPSQNTFNGIGTRLYGKNEIAESDGLYTKVLYFTFLYIPILALSKYLVHQQDGSEYVLGKGKLSGFSKIWNLLVATAVAGFIGFGAYQSHVSSAEYIAKNLYSDAIQMIEEKNYAAAINDLKLVSDGGTTVAQKAKAKVDELMEADYLAGLTPQENFAVVSTASRLKHLRPARLELFVKNFEKFEMNAPAVASDFADLIVKNSTDEDTIQLYNKKNYSLLQGLYAKDKTNFKISEKYAMLEERLNQCANCLSILEPHSDKLGTTEGARVLGQAYAAARETDKAYALLAPYVDKHIKAYHAAEANYDRVLQKVWEDSIEILNSDKAPADFYAKYDNASEEEQAQMVDEYYISRRDASPSVASAEQAFMQSTTVVPVALDLGMVLLNRAASSKDPNSRKSLLEQAEKTFLSVQNYAGDSDEFQLYLGQVYYWLGKETEGDKLFAALITKYDRSHQVLNSLSGTLRDLGAFSKSQEYAKEAYESATEQADKQIYAQSLALLADDLDDKINWLSKADQTNVYVKGDLLSTKGRKAADEERDSEALNYYKQAIEVYEKIPESSSQLNNIALIYLSRYRIGNDPKDMQAVLTKLDQAVALEPEDSILLGNAAYQYFAKAYSDLQSPLIDFAAADLSPSLSLFSYLYQNNDEKAEFRKLLGDHSSFKKALGYLEKALLLAPKNVTALSELHAVYVFMDDRDGLSNLANRFQDLELDLGEDLQQQKDYRNGVNTDEVLQSNADYIKGAKARLLKPDNANNEFNHAILNSYIFSAQTNMRLVSQDQDPSELLNLARRNHNKNACAATRSDLETALVLTLLEEGRVKNDRLGALIDKHKLILGSGSLFSIALATNVDFKNYVKQHKLLAELLSVIETGNQNFPYYPSLVDWKVFKELNHDHAETIRQTYSSASWVKDSNLLSLKKTSNQEYIAFSRMLEQELLGNDAEAKRLNQEAINNGLEIPLIYN